MRRKLAPEANRHGLLGCIGFAALLIAVLAVTLPLWQSRTAALPETRPEVTEAAEGLDLIRAELVFDPAAEPQLRATQTLTLTNRTGTAQDAVVLRSYSGAFLLESTSPAATAELYDRCYPDGFQRGGLIPDSASVNGEPVTAVWGDDASTVLILPVEQGWPDGGAIEVSLTWHAAVPECGGRFGVRDGFWTLGNLIPVPAVWENGAWDTEPYGGVGDPFRSDCADWQVTLTVPEAYTAASTGWCEAAAENGLRVYSWQADAVRDFAIVISDRWQCRSAVEGGTLVTAYAEKASSAEAMLRTARQAIRCYGALWGDDLYPSFTVCEAGLAFSGMEYPRLAVIGTETVRQGGDTLAWTVAHETAHQWWAMQVGSDARADAWQDESLCVYASLRWLARVKSEASARKKAAALLTEGLACEAARGVTSGSALDAFGSMESYSAAVYQRGSALWLALEERMGRSVLDAALKEYAGRYSFRTATREQLTEILSAYAGTDMGPVLEEYLDTLPE